MITRGVSLQCRGAGPGQPRTVTVCRADRTPGLSRTLHAARSRAHTRCPWLRFPICPCDASIPRARGTRTRAACGAPLWGPQRRRRAARGRAHRLRRSVEVELVHGLELLPVRLHVA